MKIDTQRPFLCEWATCMKAFKTPKEVENHAIAAHCPLGSDDIPCLWARCDGMKRKRFSLMTHLQDRHCHPQVSSQLFSVNCYQGGVSAMGKWALSLYFCLSWYFNWLGLQRPGSHTGLLDSSTWPPLYTRPILCLVTLSTAIQLLGSGEVARFNSPPPSRVWSRRDILQ